MDHLQRRATYAEAFFFSGWLSR